MTNRIPTCTAALVRVIAVFVLLALSQAYASAAEESRRKPVDPQSAFARLTGQITQLGPSVEGYGNGFVVGPGGCHVLTNFHVAFGVRTEPRSGQVVIVDKPESGHVVSFAFDLDPKTGRFKRSLSATVVDFGNYEPDTSRGFLGDIALLRLEQCLGNDFASLELDQPPASKRVANGALMTVSSSRTSTGRNEVLVEEGCSADQATAVTGMMLSDCQSVAGMSGSMILEKGSDGRWRLVGISTQLSSYSDGTPVSKAIYVKVIQKFLDGAGLK